MSIILSCPTSGVAPVISIISTVNKVKTLFECSIMYFWVLEYRVSLDANYLIILKYFHLFSPDFGSFVTVVCLISCSKEKLH